MVTYKYFHRGIRPLTVPLDSPSQSFRKNTLRRNGMDVIRGQKVNIEPARDLVLPAYNDLSPREAPNDGEVQQANFSAFPGPAAVSSSDLQSPPVLNIDTSFLSSPTNSSPATAQKLHARKGSSWLSHLPFVSSPGASTKRARQSILSVINDLVIPRGEEQKNVYQILASLAGTCAEHNLSLSAILQEPSIVDHTPMYWAVVNYREDLLVALLVHSRPLSLRAILDIRRACLDSSNEELFHALRVRRPPFNRTEGVQLPSPRAVPDNLVLGDRPLDEIQVTQMSEQGFTVSFEVPLWQRRMKSIGQVGIEFIAAGRIWALTFFSTDPSLPAAMPRKSRRASDAWHIMVNLLDSSPPTYFESQLIVDPLPPSSPELIEPSRFRLSRSTTFPRSRDRQDHSRISIYDCDSETLGLNTVTPAPISVFLGCGDRKLGCRTSSVDSPKCETPMMKPNTWSERGVSYTNAAVASLGEAFESQLLYGHSRYLSPDGTLRARLETSFVKPELSKECIIC